MSRSVYVFDAYGTLLDVHSAVARYQDVIGPQAERLSELWRSKQLEYTWVRTLMGAYQDFAHLTEQALDYAAVRCGGVSAQTRADLLNAYQTLNAYSDAAPCLRELRQRGARTGILSNGTPAMLQAAISAAGLTDLFDAVISVDALGIYKTAPVVYEQACQRFVGMWRAPVALAVIPFGSIAMVWPMNMPIVPPKRFIRPLTDCSARPTELNRH